MTDFTYILSYCGTKGNYCEEIMNDIDVKIGENCANDPEWKD